MIMEQKEKQKINRERISESIAQGMKNFLTIRNVLLTYLYTIIISALIAVFLMLTNPRTYFPVYLAISLSYGLVYCSIIILSLWLFKPNKMVNLFFLYFAGICLGTIISYQLRLLILNYVFSLAAIPTLRQLLENIAYGVVFGGGVSYFFYSKIRIKVSDEIIAREKFTRIALQKETMEANLRLLQAQIEPHFLFNTLSNILSLIDTEPGKGKAMLLDLTKYLRTSLVRTMPQTTLLNEEMAIITAYLNIQKIRMGERLRFHIFIADDLRQLPFPPMLLQPLVENAVKHGLEPQVAGGEIFIRASQENNLLRVEVTDTGRGFSSFTETGVGVNNVRERLRLLFGEKGRLIIEENHPCGVKAIIEVPVND